MTTEKHKRLIDNAVEFFHDFVVAGSFIWLCWSPTEPLRWVVYVASTCSALLIFRNRLAERARVHRHPWLMGIVIIADFIVLFAILAATMKHQPHLVVAVLIWISVRAMLIPRTREQEAACSSDA